MAGILSSKEIHIGEGIGQIEFGMLRQDVVEILGNPAEIEIESLVDENEEEKLEIYHYDSEGVSLAFDSSVDYELIAISSNDNGILLEGNHVVGLEYDELVAVLEDIDISDYEELDWNPQEDEDFTVVSDEMGLTFWFEGGILKEVEWTVIDSEADFMMWSSEEE